MGFQIASVQNSLSLHSMSKNALLVHTFWPSLIIIIIYDVFCGAECSNGDVRPLFGGAAASQGNVEVCFNGVYHLVSRDNFTISDASVICRQLGLETGMPCNTSVSTILIHNSHAILYHIVAGFPTSLNLRTLPAGNSNVTTRVVLNCTGSEQTISQCTHYDSPMQSSLAVVQCIGKNIVVYNYCIT